jgi:hypothetical protein
MSGVTLDHLIGGLEAGIRHFSHRQLLMVRLKIKEKLGFQRNEMPTKYECLLSCRRAVDRGAYDSIQDQVFYVNFHLRARYRSTTNVTKKFACNLQTKIKIQNMLTLTYLPHLTMFRICTKPHCFICFALCNTVCRDYSKR